MADNQTSTVSTISFPDLPVGTSLTGLEVVAVQGGATERVKWSTLSSSYLHTTDTAPTSSSAAGEAGAVYVSSTAVWTYSAGGWGASPRFTSYTGISDITATTRFLRVDAAQALSDDEKSQARINIGVVAATDTTLGLVRGSTWAPTGAAPVSVYSDGSMGVTAATPTAYGACKLALPGYTNDDNDVVTYAWMNAKFSGLGVDPETGELVAAAMPVATYSVLGAVRPYSEYFNVYTGGGIAPKLATYSTYGVTKKLDYSTWSGSGGYSGATDVVPDYSIVKAMVDAVSVPAASFSVAGTILPSSTSFSFSGSSLTLAPATCDSIGAVTVSPEMPEAFSSSDNVRVLSAEGTKTFVNARIDTELKAYTGAIATSTAAGIVMPDSTQFMINPSNGDLLVKTAGANTEGVVKLYLGSISSYDSSSDAAKAASAGTVYSLYSDEAVHYFELSAKCTTLETSISSTNSDVATLKTNYSSLNSSYIALNNKVLDLESRVKALEGK